MKPSLIFVHLTHRTLSTSHFFCQICKITFYFFIKYFCNCDLDTTGGATACSTLKPGRNLIRVTISLWFIIFRDIFSSCVHLLAWILAHKGRETKNGKTKKLEEMTGSRVEVSPPPKMTQNIVHFLSPAVTQTLLWNEGLIGWLAEWLPERMDGRLADWLADKHSDFLSIHQPLSLYPYSVCVCLLVRPISSLGRVCDWNKN